MVLNNVNVETLRSFAEQAEKDPPQAKKSKKVEGDWILEEGQPQFRATLEFPKGKQLVETDFAPFMGGWGSRPDPVQYCLYGFAACYASTFAVMASLEGIQLKKLHVTAENKIDLSRTLGLSDNPIVEKVQVTLTVDSDASQEKLEIVEKLAFQRCPAVYCLTNPIRLETQVVKA